MCLRYHSHSAEEKKKVLLGASWSATFQGSGSVWVCSNDLALGAISRVTEIIITHTNVAVNYLSLVHYFMRT